MSDVELRLTADVGQATKGVGSFRKEYAEMVKVVEKPLRQIDALQKTQESAKKASAEFFAAKRNVDQLRAAFQQAGQPVKGLGAELSKAERTLARTTLEFDRQKAKVREQRGELRAAGVDTRNLAAEQQRLHAELAKGMAAGQGDIDLRSAKGALGVGEIEATQRGLLELRRQYQLVAADATLTAKQRSEAEAAYRRRVAETLEELRKLRTGIQAGATQSELAATADTRRYAAAREGIRAQAAALAQATREQRLSNIEAARADLGVNRYRALQAELVRVRGQYQLLRTTGNLTANELALAQRNMTARVRETQRALREMNAEQRRSSGSGRSLLGGAAAAYTAYRSVTGVSRQADEWVELTDRIKMASGSQQEYERGLESLRSTSDRTFTNMSNNAEVYINALTPLREGGFSNNDALKFTETLGLGLVASAAKGERATSVINQFSDALQQGVLRGDSFNSMIRNTPALADALARGLGKTREELVAMAKAGELTTDVFVPALISQMDSLGQAVDDMTVTVGDAGTILQNAWKEALGKSDIEPLTNALQELAATMRDPAVAAGITAIASLILSLGAAAVTAGSEILELMGRVGLVVNNFRGTVPELEKIDRKIADIDRSLKGSGMKTTLAGIWYSKEELQEQRKALEAARTMLVEQQTGMSAEMQALADQAQADAEKQRDTELASYRTHIAGLKKLQDQQVKDAGTALKKQAAAEKAALRDLEKVKADRLKIEERYQEALATLGGSGAASYGGAQSLKVGARQALADGDVQGAQRQAQAALKMLQGLAAAGENTYGFSGFIQELQAIELAANDIEQTNAEQKIQSIRASMKALEEQAKALENTSIGFELDEASMEQVRAMIARLARELGQELIIPVRLQHPDGPIVQDLPPAPGFAAGGWTGPGSKYQPAGVVHADEHVQPKRVVNEPGALPFLEQIRRQGFRNTMSRLGMRGYADGGLVMPSRAMPSIPQMSPTLLSQGSPGRDLGRVDLNVGGESFSLLAEGDQFERLLRRTSIKFGRTHKN